MPLIFLEQLPLPSLQSYVTVSALLFVSSGLYSINVIRSNGVAVEEDSLDVYEFMSQSSFCFWVRFPIFIKPGTESELRSYVFLNGCSVQFVLCFFFPVKFEHGILLFILVWESYSKSCVRRSTGHWDAGMENTDIVIFQNILLRFVEVNSDWGVGGGFPYDVIVLKLNGDFYLVM